MSNETVTQCAGEGFAFFRWHCLKYPFFSSHEHYSEYFNRTALDDWRHGYRG